jgi:hypothetical protein
MSRHSDDDVGRMFRSGGAPRVLVGESRHLRSETSRDVTAHFQGTPAGIWSRNYAEQVRKLCSSRLSKGGSTRKQARPKVFWSACDIVNVTLPCLYLLTPQSG